MGHGSYHLLSWKFPMILVSVSLKNSDGHCKLIGWYWIMLGDQLDTVWTEGLLTFIFDFVLQLLHHIILYILGEDVWFGIGYHLKVWICILCRLNENSAGDLMFLTGSIYHIFKIQYCRCSLHIHLLMLELSILTNIYLPIFHVRKQRLSNCPVIK